MPPSSGEQQWTWGGEGVPPPDSSVSHKERLCPVGLALLPRALLGSQSCLPALMCVVPTCAMAPWHGSSVTVPKILDKDLPFTSLVSSDQTPHALGLLAASYHRQCQPLPSEGHDAAPNPPTNTGPDVLCPVCKNWHWDWAWTMVLTDECGKDGAKNPLPTARAGGGMCPFLPSCAKAGVLELCSLGHVAHPVCPLLQPEPGLPV